nr:hypothetical protein [Pedobacter suwonensis]
MATNWPSKPDCSGHDPDFSSTEIKQKTGHLKPISTDPAFQNA